MFSWGLHELAGDSVAIDGVVIADPGDVVCVAFVAVDAKLNLVFAESGVDLLDCGLDVVFEFCGDDDLGINVRCF